MTQKQIAALEEEARTRIQADEARAVRFRQTVERVAGDVQMLEGRLAAEENGTLQRVAKLEVGCSRSWRLFFCLLRSKYCGFQVLG